MTALDHMLERLKKTLAPTGASTHDPKEKFAISVKAKHLSLMALREKLIKVGAKIIRHGRCVTFQLAEVAVPRELFRKILSLIDDLRPRPAPA